MVKRLPFSPWTRSLERSFSALTRRAVKAGARAVGRALEPALERRTPPPGAGDWITGVAVGGAGVRRFRLYRPPGVALAERLPLLVMLHGCDQDARSFALSTRMNRLAARERFLVLYPEQDRLANGKRCWNWFDTQSGRAYGEVALIMKAVDQACLLYQVDRTRVAVAGLSAGASMAALLVARHPERFKALAMHSGIPPGTADSTLSAFGAMNGRRTTLPLGSAPLARARAWPPLLVIHGDADRVVAASNAHAAVQVWADAAGAEAAPPRSVQRGARLPMTVTDYKRGATVACTLVEIGRLGHAWSGGLASQAYGDPRGPDASRLVWAFVARQLRDDDHPRCGFAAPPCMFLLAGEVHVDS